VGGEIFRTLPDRAWGHPASYTVGTGSFRGVGGQSGRDVALTTQPPSSAEVNVTDVRLLFTHRVFTG